MKISAIKKNWILIVPTEFHGLPIILHCEFGNFFSKSGKIFFEKN